jgi:hypothetical protein
MPSLNPEIWALSIRSSSHWSRLRRLFPWHFNKHAESSSKPRLSRSKKMTRSRRLSRSLSRNLNPSLTSLSRLNPNLWTRNTSIHWYLPWSTWYPIKSWLSVSLTRNGRNYFHSPLMMSLQKMVSKELVVGRKCLECLPLWSSKDSRMR